MKFLEKFKYSITKIEKYPEMSAEGTKKAIKYISILVAILAIVTALGIIYQTFNEIQKTFGTGSTAIIHYCIRPSKWGEH